MAKRLVTHNGVTYDSLPEACMGAWCEEATHLGVLHSFELQHTYTMTPPYYWHETKQLKTKTKQVRRSLLLKSTYTSDFELKANYPIHGLHQRGVAEQGLYSDSEWGYNYCVDVKGETRNTNTKGMFSLKQKLMMITNSVYVNKLVPSKFFMVNGWPSELPKGCTMKKGGLYSWLNKDWQKSHPTIQEVYGVH